MTHLYYHNNNPRYISVLRGLIDTRNPKSHRNSNQLSKQKGPNTFTKEETNLTYSKTLDLTRKKWNAHAHNTSSKLNKNPKRHPRNQKEKDKQTSNSLTYTYKNSWLSPRQPANHSRLYIHSNREYNRVIVTVCINNP